MTARHNGLRASAYVLLIEVEESLGDHLLAAMAARQIAAYVEPVPGPGGTTRLTLYVDALQRARAGVVLAGLTPAMAGDPPAESDPPRDGAGQPAGPSDFADEAAFAALVEAFHRTPDERTWPDAEDLPAEAASEAGVPTETVLPAIPPRRVTKKFDPSIDTDRRRPAAPKPPLAPEPAEASRKRSHDDPFEDDEEHYTPPPLPRLEPPPFAIRTALLGLMLGLALLLLPTLLDFGHRTSLDIAGVVCVVGCGAVLVSRLRNRSPDDPDDGAVV
jgi:hypothetical protein